MEVELLSDLSNNVPRSSYNNQHAKHLTDRAIGRLAYSAILAGHLARARPSSLVRENYRLLPNPLLP